MKEKIESSEKSYVNWIPWVLLVLVAVVFFIWGPVWFNRPASSEVVTAEPTLSELVQEATSTVMATQQPTPEPTVKQVELAPIATPVKVVVVGSAPSLHHDESNPPESGMGSFDVGVKNGQIGLVFGVHIAWPKGDLDAGGGGCNLVILTPGWYENLQILDGRYEVYDIPSDDYLGWVEVLGQQRADEQTSNYGCPVKEYQDIPQWESTIPSPP